VQTIDRPSQSGGGSPRRGPRLPGGSGLGWVVAGIALVPVLLLLIVSKWGVLIAVLAAVTAGLGLWVWRRGFVFIEIVAFLIHFDGLGFGPVRMGRFVAAAAFAVLLYKLLVEKWRPPAVPVRHWLPPLLLVILGVASGAWSAKISAWLFGLGLLGLAMAIFSVTALMVDSHEKIEQYLRAFWVGGLFGSGAGVLALFLGTRSVGFGGDPNFFGLLQASMLALTIYYRRNASTERERFWYSVAIVFVFAGAAGAGSRSGIIGACLVIVCSMISRPRLTPGRRVRTGLTSIAIAGVAFVVLFVANPANLSRGFSDRGAGRLDAWAVTFNLIRDSPVLGHGLGQVRYKILPNLAETEGVQEVRQTRQDLSAHNTWLDIQGDLGLAGFLIWNSVLVITFVGFLRPRWSQTRELSTTLAVMMVPVMSSGFFLPLINNKLAWSLIGLAAALQVPSWGARWRGFLGAMAPALPAAPARRVPVEASDRAEDPVVGDARGEPTWRSPVLARWDLKVSRRFRVYLLAGALAGFVLFAVVGAGIPVRYSATSGIVMPQLETADDRDAVAVDLAQVQGIHSVVNSRAYAAELQRLSGIDLSPSEIERRVDVDRPYLGVFAQISYVDTDEARTDLAAPHLVQALDNVVAANRGYAEARLADELRPIYPGEQRYYTGPLYLRAYQDAVLESRVPRVGWMAVVGALTGMLVATVFVLLQQGRPRVNNDDDLYGAIRLWVWTHVGRAGRRYAATRDQYAQVVTMANELSPADRPPRRIVVTTPRPDRAARGLAMGVAGALAAEGRRVVLVDAQVDHPLLSRRLVGLGRKGLLQAADGSAPLESVVRRVNRWRLPTSVRRVVRRHGDQLRFIPVGRRPRGERPEVRPDVLDRFGSDVCLVVLAPSLLSAVPAASLLRWADATTLALVEGRTVTFDAEDAAAQVHTFASGAAGVVLLDV
jgi:O-antigen ligase